MRLQELIIEAGDDNVIDARHRFGSPRSFNNDTETHGMIKRHVQLGVDDLQPDYPINRSNKIWFAEYFEDKVIPRINDEISSVSFKNVEWLEVTGVTFSPDYEEMELSIVVRPIDPTNMYWLHEVRAYLRNEAKVAMGKILRRNT